EHVVERVRGGDRPEVVGVVDDRREEVDREDERALVVEPVDRRVVRGIEADEQVLRLGRDEAAQQLLQARGGVLRRATAGGGEIRQLHARVHPRTVTTDGGPRAAVAWGEERLASCVRRIRRGAHDSFRVGYVAENAALVTGG